MLANIFRTDRALLDDDAHLYIQRPADQELVTRLRQRDYVLIVEPAKQGKTSLLHAVMRNPVLDGMDFVFLELVSPGLDRSSNAGWYASVASELNRQFLELERPAATLPQNARQWVDYLTRTAEIGQTLGRPAVIVCDQVGTSFPDAPGFFGAMRTIYSSRNNNPTLRYLCIILAGTFDPKDLIKDPRLSPFNVAKQINLSNFSFLEVRRLMDAGNWPSGQKDQLSKDVYSWTNGQPYLTQLICSRLQADANTEAVNRIAQDLLQTDAGYLLTIADKLQQEPELVEYLSHIHAEEKIEFIPTHIRKQSRLELLGMIQGDEAWNCQFRSRLHLQIFTDLIHGESHLTSGFKKDGPEDPIEEAVNRVFEGKPDFLEQEADVVVITALDEEREAVLQKLPGHRKLSPDSTDIRTYYQADLPFRTNGMDGIYKIIVLSLPGMGRVHAAIATADAIRRWHPQYIMLVGIAGGLSSSGINMGDILIANQIVDDSLQKVTPQGTQIRWEVPPVAPRLLDACNNFTDKSWQAAIDVARPGPGEPKKHTGTIVSGDRVIAFSKILLEYRNVWKKLIGVEMEAGGASAAVFLSPQKIGFFMIRGVSDLADEEKDKPDVDKWRRYACDVAATFAIEFLKSGPVPLAEKK